MKLIAAISEGSGTINEDACGVIERDGEVIAAWVFDGVTGVNERNYLPAGTDAQWIVQRADAHLRAFAGRDASLAQVLEWVVDALVADWKRDAAGIVFPPDYDPPGACLILAKRYANGWRALRLGDSMIIADGRSVELPPYSHSGLEQTLRRGVVEMRNAGQFTIDRLHRKFHAEMLASRRSRNTEGGLGILVASRVSLLRPEYVELGSPETLMVCSDGYYRAVDTYGMLDDVRLVEKSVVAGGAAGVLRDIRAIEKADLECRRHLRVKPADDATVVVMRRA